MAANYGRPKPVDPLYWLHGRYLRVACACGHRFSQEVSDFAKAHTLPGAMLAHEMIAKLRCSRCGEKPAMAEIGERPLI